MGRSADGATLRSGCHIHCPGLSPVTLEQMLEIRRAFVARLSDVEPNWSWEKAVDEAVYSQSRSLRMVGSRKADRSGVDIGRVYRPLLVMDPDGEADANALRVFQEDPLALLRACSVRSDTGPVQSDLT